MSSRGREIPLPEGLNPEHPTLIQLHRGPVEDADDFGRRCEAVDAPFAGRVMADLEGVDPREIGELLAARPEPLYVSQGLGFTTEDMLEVATVFDRVLGLPTERGGSGFPSPWTALGVLAAIRGCVGDLPGCRISVLGTGFVGAHLVKLLLDEGAEVYAADLDAEKVEAAGALVVTPDEIWDVPCDVFSPNARGPVFTMATAPRLNCSFVAGGANGPLESPEIGAFLIGRGIRYVPEEIAGSGWILNLAAELGEGGWSEGAAREHVMRIEGLVC
ncbi:MAG: hypothetical protein ABFS86_15120 [Planctomycetota bacterium]